jgi:hypothetical protein
MLPSLEPGAMIFMMSKDGYLADDNPHFQPVFAGEDKVNRMTILPVPVPRWSDGTLDADPAK